MDVSLDTCTAVPMMKMMEKMNMLFVRPNQSLKGLCARAPKKVPADSRLRRTQENQQGGAWAAK